MDVLSALIAYEQKLTMCLSSSSFYCRLLGSKMRLFWVSVQIPLSGALPIRGDGLRGSHNGNWVGRWTNSDSTKGVRYQVAHLPTRVHTQLAEMGGFQLIFISFAVLTDEPVRRQLHSEGTGGVCPTARVALLRPSGIFGFPSVPCTDELRYPWWATLPWAWCAGWKEVHTPSLAKHPYVSQLSLLVLKNSFALVIIYLPAMYQVLILALQ